MYKLGITGGISSGKTTAAEYFKLKEGSFVFNADKESKRHLKNSKGLQKKIINSFGQGIVKNNKLALDLLAEKAFSNETNHRILNGIMWPEVFIIISKKYEEIKDTNYKLFVVDAALIFEANFNSFFDSTLLITAPEKLRINRAVERRNMPLESIQNRISLQMSDMEKKRLAVHTIVNSNSVENFYTKLDKFYDNLKF